MHEIIEIGSSPVRTKTRTEHHNSSPKLTTLSSDGFNSSIFDDDEWLYTRHTKKRKSVVVEATNAHPRPADHTFPSHKTSDDDRPLNYPTVSKATAAPAKPTTFSWEEDFSDDIVFTSSAPESRDLHKKEAKQSTVIELDDDPQFLDDETFSFSQPTETRKPLSNRTANLLANITANTATTTMSVTGRIIRKADALFEAEQSSKSRRKVCKEDDIFNSSPPLNAKGANDSSKFQNTAKAMAKAAERAAVKAAKEAAKEEEMERKRLAKEEKAKEKQLAADIAEVNKAKHDKKNSTPEMILDLPKALEGTSVANQSLEYMKHLGVQTEFSDTTTALGNVVKWRRKVRAQFDEEAGRWEPVPEFVQEENHVLCYLAADEFVELSLAGMAKDTSAEKPNLDLHVTRLTSRYQHCKVIYVIEGLTAWLRKNRNNRNRAYQDAIRSQDSAAPEQPNKRKRKQPIPIFIDEDAVEDALLQLQVQHNCLIYQTSCAADSAAWIKNYTEHISTIPYRHERMNAHNDAAFCMDVGQVKTGDNAQETYIRMLQEVHRLTPAMAYGIANLYPNVCVLVAAFKQRGPTMLEDVRKSANKDGGVTEARLGPAISKRLYKVFLGINPGSTDGIT